MACFPTRRSKSSRSRGTDAAVTLTYRDADGQVATRAALPRRRGALCESRSGRGAWSFDADGKLFRLASEALRIRARVPLRPVPRGPHVEPRPAAAPDPRRLRGDAAAPAAALPARRRPRRRQDDHGRAAHQGADGPRRPAALPDRRRRGASSSSGRTSSRSSSGSSSRSSPRDDRGLAQRQPVRREATSSSPASTSSSRNEELQAKLEQTDWDLVVVDEAHKMSAHYFGNEVKKTKRYQLGELLGDDHPPLPADDGDAAQRQGGGLPALHGAARRRPVRGQAARTRRTPSTRQDLMRRLVKEKLLTFDGQAALPRAPRLHRHLPALRRRERSSTTRSPSTSARR